MPVWFERLWGKRTMSSGVLSVLALILLSGSSGPAGTRIRGAFQMSIDADLAAARVPFVMIDGRILIDVTLNGRGPFRMIFDSGASAVISRSTAQKLRLYLSAPHLESGTGKRSTEVATTTVELLNLGAAELVHLPADVMPLVDMPPVFGTMRIDGILGRPVFDRYVIEVDYADRVLILFDPKRFRPAIADVALSFSRIREVPLVSATLDGHIGLFGVDLGARSALLVNAWLPDTAQLQTLFRGAPKMVTGWGLGGPIYGKLGRAHDFTLAGMDIKWPLVRLSMQSSGLLSRTDTAGLIGSDILRQFTITFDSLQHVMYFRSKLFGVATKFDQSGMWIIPSSHGFRVIDVVPGGAAQRPGLCVNDEIRAVDGHAADRLLLPELRDRWAEEAPGTLIHLKVRPRTYLPAQIARVAIAYLMEKSDAE